MKASAAVLVLGSINVDRTYRVDHLPLRGETLCADAVLESTGGKGANQAFAARKLNPDVVMLGVTGMDAGGTSAREALRVSGIDVDHIGFGSNATGSANVLVERHGENSIVVWPGANAECDGKYVRSVASAFSQAAVVVLQAEIPVEGLAAACDLSSEHGIRVVLNLAPYVSLPEEVIRQADPLILNETEACSLLQLPPSQGMTVLEALDHVEELSNRFSGSAIITLGSSGSVGAVAGRSWHQPSLRVGRTVDTTGAGDAYVGVLAAALANGSDLAEAMTFASAASGISVTSLGTSESYPDRAEVAAVVGLPARFNDPIVTGDQAPESKIPDIILGTTPITKKQTDRWIQKGRVNSIRMLDLAGKVADPAPVQACVALKSADWPYGNFMMAWLDSSLQTRTIWHVPDATFFLALLQVAYRPIFERKPELSSILGDESRTQISITNDVLQLQLKGRSTGYSMIRHHSLMLFIAILWLEDPARKKWLTLCDEIVSYLDERPEGRPSIAELNKTENEAFADYVTLARETFGTDSARNLLAHPTRLARIVDYQLYSTASIGLLWRDYRSLSSAGQEAWLRRNLSEGYLDENYLKKEWTNIDN